MINGDLVRDYGKYGMFRLIFITVCTVWTFLTFNKLFSWKH